MMKDRTTPFDLDSWIATATVADLIGQMSQLDINMLVEDDGKGGKRLNQEAAAKYIGDMGVGSVLNLVATDSDQPPTVMWDARQYREVQIALNQIADRHGRPPVIWGLDSVHGANYIRGAILSPQPLNLAATFNTSYSTQAGRLAARDTRAAGIAWLFAPLIGLALEPKWSRVYETFGEDPVLVGTMAAAMIRGIQQVDTTGGIPIRAAASAKHFCGYSMPRTGHDRSPSWIPRRHLYQYFVPPWKKVMQADHMPLTVMESYTEVDGVPMVANREQLGYLLRQRLGFTGVLVTDYEEIRNLHNWHKAAASENDAVITSLQQGTVDMSMIPRDFDSFAHGIGAGLDERRLTLERLQTSARRVLELKDTLGLFNNTVTIVDPNLDLVGTDRDAVYPMVLDSMILAENRNALLPLDPKTPLKVHLTGPTANSMAYQSGGWTYQWQGSPGEDWFTYGASVWHSLKKESAWTVSYSCGVDILGRECEDPNETHPDESIIDQFKHWSGLTPTTSMAMAVEAARGADVTIICLGEESAAEKPADISSLSLPKGQYDLLHAIQRNTDTKIILVFFGGRPRLLSDCVDSSDAVVLGFLPGPDGGPALMDILTGRVNPSGRLPITYPLLEDGGGVPYFHAVTDQCTRGADNTPSPHWEYVPCPVQWPFGHGLSYTSFAYSAYTAHGGIDDDLAVEVTVTNTGSRPGRDVVMVFTFDAFRKTTPEYKRLRAFETVLLDAGQSIKVNMNVPLVELRFIGPDNDRHYVLDPKMVTYVGVGYDTDCRADPDNVLCHKVTGNMNRPDAASCEAACNIWRDSPCSDTFQLNNKRCNELCLAVDPMQNQGWGWNYVECLESVVWGIQQQGAGFSADKDCWKMKSLCRDIFATGPLTEYGAGPVMGKPVNVCATWNNEAASGVGSPTVWTAILSALVASGIMLMLLRGWFSTRRKKPVDGSDEERYEGIQFTTIPNHIMD